MPVMQEWGIIGSGEALQTVEPLETEPAISPSGLNSKEEASIITACILKKYHNQSALCIRRPREE